MAITALPTPPSRQDSNNFNDRADAFLGALPLFTTEANAQAAEVNAASANAVAANNAVIAATNITKWTSGTTYANGAVVWSPINGLAYRRITASGSGTTDPSSDTTNYKQVNGTGDVSTSGDQTISGVKTFTSGVALGVDLAITDGGTGASTALSAFDNLKQSATDSYVGVVELATSAEAIAGTDTTRVLTPATLRSANIVSGTAVASTSGTSIDFTSIPSWVTRITILFAGVSTSGATAMQVQVGAGSILSTGYLGAAITVSSGGTAAAVNTTGFLTAESSISSYLRNGSATLNKITGNQWVFTSILGNSENARVTTSGGSVSLGSALDRVRITTFNGTDTFDSGTINIMWE